MKEPHGYERLSLLCRSPHVGLEELPGGGMVIGAKGCSGGAPTCPGAGKRLPRTRGVGRLCLQAFAEIVGQTSGWCPHRPAAVVLPGSTAEVQAVVRICLEHGLRLKAMSTGWGIWNMVSGEDVVQVDLRRMDRILEIDERNMYAVVEPYVSCAQLQAETMKRGLNCYIIGAGAGTSPLASATSLCGYGWSGLTTGYSARNLLGVEWVLPDGEVLRLGSHGSGLGWFSGDGPGPSLRGVARGFIGNCGSLGIFTACAVKPFPGATIISCER